MGFSKFLGHSKDKDAASAPAPIATSSHLERNPNSNSDSGYGGSDPSVTTERTYRPQDASSLTSSDESAPRHTDQDGNIVTTTTTTTTTITTSGGKNLGTTVENHGPVNQPLNYDNNGPQPSSNFDTTHGNRNQQASPPIPMRSSLRGTSPNPPAGHMNGPPPGTRMDGPPGNRMEGPPPGTRMDGPPPGTHMGGPIRDRSPVGAASPSGRPNFSYPGRGPYPQPAQPAGQLPPGAQQVSPMSQQQGQSTLQGLKSAAKGINGVSETLRGTLNSAVDRHTNAPPEVLAEHDRTIQNGREQMEASRLMEHRGNQAPPKGILKKSQR